MMKITRTIITTLCQTIALVQSTTTTTTTKQQQTLRHQNNNHHPTTTLSNGYKLPLLGIGVGNLPHDLIVPQLSLATGELGTTLIDTAMASRNDAFVLEGIQRGIDVGDQNRATDGSTKHVRSTADHGNRTVAVVDIVTKVWYTHLGYERTSRVVHDTIDHYSSSPSSSSDIHLHILIHWPRCRTDIPWMRCEEEEDELPEEIRRLSDPPPLSDPDGALVESWRALMDLYRSYGVAVVEGEERGVRRRVAIASIGVSNFSVEDLRLLQSSSPQPQQQPHLIQMNLWSYLFDPDLVAYCETHSIVIQVYNIMNGIFGDHSRGAEASYAALTTLTGEYAAIVDPIDVDDAKAVPDVQQMVLRYLLLDANLSVIPRTTSVRHLVENSWGSLKQWSLLSSSSSLSRMDAHNQIIDMAIRGCMEGRDRPELHHLLHRYLPTHSSSSSTTAAGEKPPEPQAVRFINGMVEGVIHLFWLDEQSGDEKRIGEVRAGEEIRQDSWTGHVFVAYDGGGGEGRVVEEEEGRRKEFRVDGGGEGLQDFHVEF